MLLLWYVRAKIKSKATCQSVRQSVSQSVRQSVRQSVSQAVSQSDSQSVRQTVSQAGRQSVRQAVSQSVRQSGSQSNTALFNALLHVPVPKESSPSNSTKTLKPHQHLVFFTLRFVGPDTRLPFSPSLTQLCLLHGNQTHGLSRNNTSLGHAIDILRTVGLNLELFRSKYKQQR